MLKISTDCVVLPEKFLNGFVTDFYLYLVQILQAINPRFQLVSSRDFTPSNSLKRVFIVSLAHWPDEHLHKIRAIHPSTTVYCWYDDVIWRSEEARKANVYLFDKVDCIVYSSKYAFLDMWGKYESKSFWVPFFVSPYGNLPYTTNVKPRCLLAGSCEPHYYPVRHYIKSAESPFVDVLEHPGYTPGNTASGIRSNYHNLLASYFCCVTDGGQSHAACNYMIVGQKRVFDRPVDEYLVEMMGSEKFLSFKTRSQVVLKFFEIPAAGSLLIVGAKIPDLDEMGFKHFENYICTSQTEVLDVIADCCSHPDRYEFVRRNGWEHSKLHTMQQRQGRLKEILEAVDAKRK